MNRLELITEQIEFARGYTVRLLDHTDSADWFRQPAGGVTHIAWQVGHLAMAQYRLGMERVRGVRPTDEGLIPQDFLRLFLRDSVPDPDPKRYPGAEAIRAVFDRVHRQLLDELRTLSDAELDAPVVTSHALVRTKYWALVWCAQYEAVHAGQIGLLRRLLGHPPVW